MILNTLFFNILNIKDDYLTFINGTAVNNAKRFNQCKIIIPFVCYSHYSSTVLPSVMDWLL